MVQQQSSGKIRKAAAGDENAGKSVKELLLTLTMLVYPVFDEAFEDTILLHHQDEFCVRFELHVLNHAVRDGQRAYGGEVCPVFRVSKRVEQSALEKQNEDYLPETYPFGVAVIPNTSRGTWRRAMQSRMQSSHSRCVANIYTECITTALRPC